MDRKPIYTELEQTVKKLEKEAFLCDNSEKGLLESEVSYRNLVENIQEGIWLINKD